MSNAIRTPAEVYDELFVPALFSQWSGLVADAARIGPGQRVLDVACGTGVLTSTAAERAGATGSVVGLDSNDEMLAVARRRSEDISWRVGRAEELPFEAESFDAVVSQFGLMFFDDRVAALREMMRVLRPGGRIAVAVCGALDHSPGYAVLAELLHRLFGEPVAQSFRAPFSCGDRDIVHMLCTDAGIGDAAVARRDGTVSFASIETLVEAERACVWTLGGLLDERQFARLRTAAEESLQPFENADGVVEFGMPALLLTAQKP